MYRTSQKLGHNNSFRFVHGSSIKSKCIVYSSVTWLCNLDVSSAFQNTVFMYKCIISKTPGTFVATTNTAASVYRNVDVKGLFSVDQIDSCYGFASRLTEDENISSQATWYTATVVVIVNVSWKSLMKDWESSGKKLVGISDGARIRGL